MSGVGGDHWVVVASANHLLVHHNQFLHRFRQLELDPTKIRAKIPLGLHSQEPCLLLVLDESHNLSQAPFVFASLRSLLHSLDEETFAFAGRALQLLHWWDRHQYCGRCGRKTQSHPAECSMVCSYCSIEFYPHVAPCVIGIVTKGSKCLLARHTRSTSGFYSLLAGFIEPGETAEQALAREVREEVGIAIEQISYLASQSWPFPSQLMLGFEAQHASGDIQVDGVEIAHADWFDVDDLPAIPPAETISGRLIRAHIERVRLINSAHS